MAEYGVVTEQGDLGLGFDLLNQPDNKAVNESVEREQQIHNDNKDQENK